MVNLRFLTIPRSRWEQRASNFVGQYLHSSLLEFVTFQISLITDIGRVDRLPAWITWVTSAMQCHALLSSFIVSTYACWLSRPFLPPPNRRVIQDLSVSPAYEAIFWNPPQKYKFKNQRPKKPKAIKVYEAHGEFVTSIDPWFADQPQLKADSRLDSHSRHLCL